jgi:UDP-N-acetylmuramate: L-alanyl-gamma-D-glutamyl-meso-diaminopimelate ligase
VVVGNAEFDHADIYADYAAVELAFQRLVNLVPRSGLLLLGADDPGAVALARFAVSPVETFGLSTEANWRASEISYDESFTAFTLHRGGVEFGQFRSPLLGLHNLRNALAAIAVGAWVGLKSAVLTHGLAEFGGIKRRLEVVGESRGVMVIDDFAHHPTAVRETLAALRSGYPSRRVWAVFEPRSASSCQRVFQDAYAEAFGAADEVVVAAVYRLSLPEAERLDAARLVRDLTARGQRARYLPDVPAIIDVIAAEARPTDLVLVMSNGDFDGIHVKLLAALA